MVSTALSLADDEEAIVAAVAAVTAEAVALPDRVPAGQCPGFLKSTCLYCSSSAKICKNED